VHTLRGQVLDGSGEAVAYEAVVCRREGEKDSRAYTDDTGRFVLRGLAAGPWSLEVRGAAAVSLRVPADEPVLLRVSRRERLPIEGIVLDADGIPVPKAMVQARSTEEQGDGGGQAGLSGRFRLLVPAGRYSVEASFSSYTHGSRQASMVFPSIDVEAGAPAVEIRAHLGRTIEGRIDGLPGMDLAGVNVEAAASEGPVSGRAMSGTTDADGRFVIVGLRDGPYTVSVRRSAWLVDPVEGVEGGTKDLRLVVRPGVEIVGRLHWGGGPMPTGLVVEARSGRTKALAIVRDDGTFRCEGLRPGTYVLRVAAESPRIRVEREVDAPARDLTIRLPR
jgi:hypothetical protein